jgi:5-methyltetrahydropteroyltriglutamate--homocysteine methyltransferase
MAIKTTLVSGFPKIGDTTEEQKLRRSLHLFDKGELDEERLAQVKNEVTQDVIRIQVDGGVDIVTDGQIRWDDPLTYATRKILGFKHSGLIRYFDTNTFYRQPIAESRLEAPKPISVTDYQFATANSSKPVKAVLTGPFTIAKLSANPFYREEKQLVFDLAHILHREVQALEEAGCQYIHFDEPALLSYKDEFPIVKQAYEVMTAQLTKAEKTIFLNFGNVEGIFPKIFQLPVERIGIDLSIGHPNWDIIKGTKWTKRLVAGVVDARNTKMESEGDIAQAIQGLGDQIDFEALWLSPNFSFEYLPRSNAKKKIELLVKVAKQLNELRPSGAVGQEGASVSS